MKFQCLTVQELPQMKVDPYAEDVPPLLPGILHVIEGGEDLHTNRRGSELHSCGDPTAVAPNNRSSPAEKLWLQKRMLLFPQASAGLIRLVLEACEGNGPI